MITYSICRQRQPLIIADFLYAVFCITSVINNSSEGTLEGTFINFSKSEVGVVLKDSEMPISADRSR